MSLIIGRLPGQRPSVIKSWLALLNPLKSSRRACTDALSSVRLLRPESPLVRMPPRNVHSVVFSPTGGGKGVSIVLPWLLTNADHSCVCIDFKGENYVKTGPARRRMGHTVVALDPFRLVTRNPDRLNPLSLIDPESPHAIDDCRTVAEAVIVRQGTEHEPCWNDNAELFVGGITSLVVCESAPHLRSLELVRSYLADPVLLRDAMQRMCASNRWGDLLARWGSQLKHPGDKERGSILSTVGRNLAFLDSMAVAESVASTTFDPAELRRGKMTVYLIIPPDRIRTQTGLLRLWVSTLLRSVVKQGLEE